MGHNTEKIYYEYLAKCLLESSLPEKYHSLSLSDRPDLISETSEGIEVTRTFLKNFGQSSAFFKSVEMKPCEEINPTKLEKFEQLGNQLIFVDNKAVGFLPEAVWINSSLLKQALDDKLSKLKEYSICKENSLFIFSPFFNYYDINDIKEFCAYAHNLYKTVDCNFKTIYVYDEPVLYQCSPAIGRVQAYKFSYDQIHNCCVMAKEYAEG